MKRALIVTALSIIIVILALYITGEIYRSLDYRDKFIECGGSLTESTEHLIGERDGHMEFEIALGSSTGIRVAGFLKTPSDDGTLHPAFLILGGLRTGRKTLDYISDTRGIVMLALDYPYEGKTERMSTWEFIMSVPRIRRAVLDTAPAVRAAVDYLLERDDVDPGRIIVIGGSLGAFFVPAHAAIDDRTAAAVMIYGAGDIQSMLESSREIPRLLSQPAGWLGAVLLSPVEPLKYISDISPRPLLMINGIQDPRIPARCSRLLHDRAGEPKTVKWLDTGHVAVQDEEFQKEISETLKEWLVEQRLVPRECFVTASP